MFSPQHGSRDVVLRLIALMKFVKGVALLVAGVGVLNLVNRELADVVYTWSRHLHLDPDGRLTAALVMRASAPSRSSS